MTFSRDYRDLLNDIQEAALLCENLPDERKRVLGNSDDASTAAPTTHARNA